MRPSTLASLIAVSTLLSASAAAADDNQRFVANRFDPAEKGSDWFTQESLDLRGAARPAVGIVSDYSTRSLVIKNFDDSERAAIVTRQYYLHLGASFTLADRIRLGVSLPLALVQDGDNGVVNSTAITAPSKAAIGDLRLGADARLFGQYGETITGAFGIQAHLPTGSQSQFTGDGSVRVVPRVIVAGDLFDIFAYSFKAGYEIRGNHETFAGREINDELVGGAAFGIRVFDRHLIVGPEFAMSTLAKDPFKNLTTPAEVIGGAHYTYNDWKIGGGIGFGATDAIGSPRLRVLLGVEWTPFMEVPKPDRDNDGVPDADDACPDQAGVKTDDPKTNGCPAAAAPPPPPPPVAAPPPPPPPDRDGDTILDADDACPDQAGVKTDDPKTNGCPAPVDKDGDGIKDPEDACPDQPGPKNDDPKKNGCPIAAVVGGEIKITEEVKFKTGSAELLAESDGVLNAVLKVMNDHPELKRVQVQGHTDNKGTPKGNKTLSEKRAASVMAWLIMHGVDKSRLTSAGFGQDRPIDSNATDEGRKNNRRVEFKIEQGPDTKPDAASAAGAAKPDAAGAAKTPAAGAAKPDAAKPDAAKPPATGAAKPDAAKPPATGAAKPDAAKPDAAKPPATEPKK